MKKTIMGVTVSFFMITSARCIRAFGDPRLHVPAAANKVDQGEAHKRDGHFDEVLPFHQRRDRHHSIESKGDKDHAVDTGRDGITDQHPEPLGALNSSFRYKG